MAGLSGEELLSTTITRAIESLSCCWTNDSGTWFGELGRSSGAVFLWFRLLFCLFGL